MVAGNVTIEKVKALAEKWFGDIPAGEKYKRNLPQEPEQTEERKLEIKANVPLDAFYKCWHMPGRLDRRYYIIELLSDILSGGGSSRLYQSLVKEKQLFSNIECHHFGSTDNGLVAIEGKLVKGVKMEDAEKAVELELEKMKNELVSEAGIAKSKKQNRKHDCF